MHKILTKIISGLAFSFIIAIHPAHQMDQYQDLEKIQALALKEIQDGGLTGAGVDVCIIPGNCHIDIRYLPVLDQVFETGAKIINISIDLGSDSLTGYEISESLLKEIEQKLVKRDQMIILAATNDQSATKNNTNNPHKYDYPIYYKQFAKIPNISSRILLVSDVFPRNNTYNSSNWPGQDLSALTVCAFGRDIDPLNTALKSPLEAAAKVTAFCVLVKEFHQNKGVALNGPQLVNFVKRSAIPLGDSEEFGHGLIDFRSLKG